jgi:hypothetical protein
MEDDNEEMIEPDLGHIAFLDQQSAAFASEKEQFKATYGFEHECTCGLDYAANRVGMVTECFMRLCSSALDRAAFATMVNNSLGDALNEAITIANDLVKMMQDHGHGDELDAYFRKQAELETEADTDEFEQQLKELEKLMEEMPNEQTPDDGNGGDDSPSN